MAAAEPIRDTKQLKRLTDYFLKNRQYRNHALIVMGVYTALRISDLLKLKWTDVYDGERGVFMDHITVTEKKTGKKKTIPLPQEAAGALRRCMEGQGGKCLYVFSNGRKKEAPIGRTQAWRIIHGAAALLGIPGRIACHSLRKTWGYHAWSERKLAPVLIMEAFNHSSYEVTRRYLGIQQDDMDRAFLSMDFGL